MRERILNAIYKIIDSEEEKDLDKLNHLQRQIILLNKANICTIDSFCLDIIKNNFFEIDVSPNFRIADTAEIELIKQDTLEKIFEEKYEDQDIDFEKLIKTYTSYRGDEPLKELILKIYNYIQSNPYPLKWLEEKIQEFNIKEINQDFSENKWGKILLNSIKEELEDGIKKLKAESKKLEVEPELDSYYRVIQSDIAELETLYSNMENWDKAYKISNNIEFVKWPVSKKITNPEKENAKSIRDSVKKAFTEKKDKIFVSNSQEANKDLIQMYENLSKLGNIIKEFDKEFKCIKKEKNIVDFSDIEHLALKILVKEENEEIKPTEIAKKYQEKFEEIAIDEYQDSNLVQEYILTSVSRGSNIFMVGDVKQSIYKFRQAMPDLFLEKYKNYKSNLGQVLFEESTKNGEKIKLYKNFRSRENILKFTNLIFENIMGENLGEINYNEEEYLNLGSNYADTKEELITEIDILDTLEDDEVSDDVEKIPQKEAAQKENFEETENIEDVELEAKFVAKKIKNLIDNKFQVYDMKNECYRDIKYKDIAILLRSTKNKASIFEKELIRQNIDVYSDTSTEYLDSYEIQVMMDLLKIIDNPYQDLPLVHVMLSSIGMFTNDDLVEIRLCDKQDDFYTAVLKARLCVNIDLKEKLEEFLNKISSWREKNNYMDLDELIWTIYEETGFLNYVNLMPNGAFRVANLKMLFERAKQYANASFNGLFNFINFMEKVKTGSGDLGSAKIISENENVVRIMSIHKSKGLEFPIVFLSSTGTGFNMTDLNDDILLHQKLGIGVKYIDYDMQIKYDTFSKLALKEKIFGENLAEEMRILYVALTRAKEKLYITAVKKDYEGKNKKMEEVIDIYSKEGGKINPILLKKYKKYIDWILLVYSYNKELSKDIMKINILNKKDILKDLKNDKQEETDIFSILENGANNISKEEILELQSKLAFNYKYKDLQKIPTKAGVTNIINKNMEVEDFSKLDSSSLNEASLEKNLQKEPVPKEKISPSKRGTLIHLCMKCLQFNKNYTLEEIKDLIKDLEIKEIITSSEASSINPYVIYNFTKSTIWSDLQNAKEYHKEEPFYINIPANEIMETNITEDILVQGIIDLYYINQNDELILLDYKTDFAKEGDEQILINKHKEQLLLYKRALEGALNRKVNKIYIYSTGLNKGIEVDIS